MLRRLLGRGPKVGSIWTGGYAYCIDQTLVSWPGLYGTKLNKVGHEVVDETVKLEFAEDGVTLRVAA